MKYTADIASSDKLQNTQEHRGQFDILSVIKTIFDIAVHRYLDVAVLTRETALETCAIPH